MYSGFSLLFAGRSEDLEIIAVDIAVNRVLATFGITFVTVMARIELRKQSEYRISRK